MEGPKGRREGRKDRTRGLKEIWKEIRIEQKTRLERMRKTNEKTKLERHGEPR